MFLWVKNFLGKSFKVWGFFFFMYCKLKDSCLFYYMKFIVIGCLVVGFLFSMMV